jgi:thioredoxin reductase (NADPH)
MKLPFIVIVDDDIQVLRAIQRDVRNRYREDYRILATESAREALEAIKELTLKNETVALFISDQRMPEMEGIEFLEKARALYPEAKQVLLTAYSDIEAAIRAINTVKLDYYLLKPWDPPEEKLYPVLTDLLNEWQALFRPDHEGIRIIGFQWSPKSHKVKEFLSGNLIPYLWMDVETHPDAEKYLISANITRSELPLVVLRDGSFLIDPSLSDLGKGVGLRQQAAETMYDIVIVGAGPAGLAASVYGSGEGFKTLLIERSNPGGQASSSARIENYLGFPNGLSGAELSMRAIAQTLRFGTEILTPQEVKSITLQDGYKIVELSDGSHINTKTIVIATGVSYTTLAVPGIERFAGAGVYYGAASVEANACRNEDVYIIGGGNSACQAAMHLAKFAKSVHMLIRRDTLKETAANYLIENIRSTPNITVHPFTQLTSVAGDTVLEQITYKHVQTGEETTAPTKTLFIYIGQKPATNWINGDVFKEKGGLIITGSDVAKEKNYRAVWKLDREPYLPETSVPGIFAAGDVRFGCLTGISAAVGEGALAIRFVRKYLLEM